MMYTSESLDVLIQCELSIRVYYYNLYIKLKLHISKVFSI